MPKNLQRRPQGSALHHLQLLPAPAAVPLGPGAESVCADSGPGAPTLRVRRGGLRRYAGACPPADQRAAQGHAIGGDAGSQAEGLARDSAEAPQGCSGSATAPELWRLSRGAATVLAEALPRFQCVERQKEEKSLPAGRQAGVHALKPGEARSGGSSDRLGVEQRGDLPQTRNRYAGD